MAGTKTENEKPPTIVIKRIKKVAGGHHGGAWKVAYADFVTAMMAFFLLLWLLNVTTDEQKNSISNYFDPSHPKISDVVSGAGGLLGGLTMAPDGAMVSTVQPIVQPEQPDTSTRGALEVNGAMTESEKLSEQQMEEELRKKEDARFKIAADNLKAAIANSPDLKELINNLVIDITPEGLRIQIVDDKGRSMFPSGSAVMFDFMRKLLTQVTVAILPLPNQVSVRGHTDSVKYKDPKGYDNWNLSADRAQASRRVMVEAKLPEKRIENVMGRSDREHLLPKEPANPRNRRISIVLLRDHIKQAPRPLPAQKQPAISNVPAERATEKPATGKPVSKGIQIIDDTQPGQPVVAGGGRGTAAAKPGTGNAPAATQGEDSTYQDGSNVLPVAPGAGASARRPTVVIFGDAPATQGDQLYTGPVQSPFVPANKPPTIRTPVFKTDDIPAPKPAPVTPAAPVMPQSTLTFGDTTATPARDIPDLQLINPKANPKVITFDAPEEAPVPAKPAPRPESNGDSKTLTFD